MNINLSLIFHICVGKITADSKILSQNLGFAPKSRVIRESVVKYYLLSMITKTALPSGNPISALDLAGLSGSHTFHCSIAGVLSTRRLLPPCTTHPSLLKMNRAFHLCTFCRLLMEGSFLGAWLWFLSGCLQRRRLLCLSLCATSLGETDGKSWTLMSGQHFISRLGIRYANTGPS